MESNPGDRQPSTRIVQYLVRLPVIDRIKAVKDLIVNQLDGLQATSGALLANNTPLLESMISLVQALEQTRSMLTQEIHESRRLLTEEIQESRRLLTEEIQESRRLFTEEIQESRRLLTEGLTHEVQELRQLLDAAFEPGGIAAPVYNSHDLAARSVAGTAPGGSGLFEPEAALMSYLYSFLRDRCALDVGAHIGEVSEMLLDAGFEVHAFEPYPPVFDRLNERLGHRRAFQAHPWALGEADRTGTLHIVSDTSGRQLYRDSTLYSSLVQHAMPSDLVFTDSLEVAVKRLDTLHSAAIIPERVGLVKIDAEGFDLHVVQGMGPHRYPVVVSEYWDSRMPFGGAKGIYSLEDMVREMRSRQYYWHIAFYRIWGREGTRFYCNFPRSLEGAWGNVFFFQDHDVFSRAREWSSTVFPFTFLTH